ncbi:MAG: hypothetical protein AAFP22_23800, partial [Planctomycetota bacterium]
EGCVTALAAQLPGWLAHAPTLSILATSRVPLGIRGEQRWRVQPLPVPAPGRLPDVIDSDAVQLFVDRARDRDGAFAIRDDDDARHVARIVRRVDGLPLAIELAAAHASVLPLAALADSLEASFGSLVADEADRPSRHRTTDATLAWSWQSLPPRARRSLAVLTVFEGSFDWTAAEAVLGMLDTSPRATLRRLIDASLVARPSPGRFDLLELVRDFAGRHLDTHDAAVARERHAEHYAAGPFDPADFTQIVAACRHAATHRTDSAHRLLVHAWRQLRYRGPFDEIATLAQSVVETATAPEVLADAHRVAGSALARVGRMDEARDHLERARDAAERTGDPRLRALTVGALGVYHMRIG